MPASAAIFPPGTVVAGGGGDARPTTSTGGSATSADARTNFPDLDGHLRAADPWA